ncbi:MAG: hypothetical protein KME54_27900 [Tolypothrix brevis GSE-NOS-MK-07-07A]|nr:hypothetical protein [Tolypothrix brevis GSE-NOS-MK-07-07A]
MTIDPSTDVPAERLYRTLLQTFRRNVSTELSYRRSAGTSLPILVLF